jgi:type IV pilus assembly protein PilV
MNTLVYRHATHDTGFTVIEVLISLLVLSVGMMGLASLQVVGLQNTQGGAQRTQAAFLAYDITDRMRTNTAAVTAGGYNYVGEPGAAGQGNAVNCIGVAANCSAAQLAAFDLAQWQTLLGTYLSNGFGSIATVDNGTTTDVTVTVQWADAYTVADGNEIVTFTTELLQ